MIKFSSHLKWSLPYSGVVSIVVVQLYKSTDCGKRLTEVILYVQVHLSGKGTFFCCCFGLVQNFVSI